MASTQRLRVTEIEVQNLFGLYSYKIPLNSESRVTIIHGPNGVGKTVILGLVKSLFAGDYTRFLRIPFQRFAVKLGDESLLAVTLLEPAGQANGQMKSIRVSVTGASQESDHVDFTLNAELSQQRAEFVASHMPWLSRVAIDVWIDDRTGEELGPMEVLARFGDQLPEKVPLEFQEPEWLVGLRKRVHIHLIESQRLIARRPRDVHAQFTPRRASLMISTVKQLATDLKRQFSQTLARYANESQSLDQSFPQRLLSGHKQLDETELKRRMGALENRRGELRKIGLVESTPAYPLQPESLEKLGTTEQTVMTLYVEDTAAKLRVFESLALRIELLLRIINQKFRHKHMEAGPSEGLIAVDDNSRPLDLESLSSGEQHELVMTYDLLFRVRYDSLVMIDEPELSLHILWQKSFLPDLLEIVKARHFDVLLATHSPFIAGDHEDLMVPLAPDPA